MGEPLIQQNAQLKKIRFYTNDQLIYLKNSKSSVENEQFIFLFEVIALQIKFREQFSNVCLIFKSTLHFIYLLVHTKSKYIIRSFL